MGNLMSRREARRGGEGRGAAAARAGGGETLLGGAGARGWPGGGVEPLHTTETVRNDLNLRKESLKVVADPTRPGFYLVSFVFDANVPCTVAVYFLARELEQGSQVGELR